jgi:hypothetical protein
LGKDITLYYDGDPRDIKSRMPEMLRRYHIENNLDALGELVRKYSVFGRLFEHETLSFKAADFRDAIAGTVEDIRLTVALNGLSQLEPGHFRFGCIVLRLAGCGQPTAEYKKCAVTNEKRNGTFCTMNESRGVSCGFLEEVTVKDAAETVILNSILHDTVVSGNLVELTVPIHNRYCVTVKCFVDVKDKSVKSTLEKLLRDAGMEDVSYSESGESQRIYFLLPESHKDGLFHIVSPEGIVNNYFCPGASAD